MVRQQWNQWMVDMFFPMNYNDYYGESTDWVNDVVKEEVESAGGVPVMSALRTTRHQPQDGKKEKPADFGLTPSELKAAILNSLNSGANGICLLSPGRMNPEHWDALEESLKEFGNSK